MRLLNILKNVDYKEKNLIDVDINSICYDSRKVIEGTLFVAIKGFQDDGHKYISKAVEN